MSSADGDAPVEKPDFPLLPVSKGFCISLSKALKQFRDALRAAGIYGVVDSAPAPAAKEEEESMESEAQQDEEPGEGAGPTAVAATASAAGPSAPPAAAASPGTERPRTPPPTYADVIEEDRRKMTDSDIK